MKNEKITENCSLKFKFGSCRIYFVSVILWIAYTFAVSINCITGQSGQSFFFWIRLNSNYFLRKVFVSQVYQRAQNFCWEEMGSWWDFHEGKPRQSLIFFFFDCFHHRISINLGAFTTQKRNGDTDVRRYFAMAAWIVYLENLIQTLPGCLLNPELSLTIFFLF